MSDPIADLIIRLKNATLANLKVVIMPYSNFKLAILSVFKKHGFIESVSIKTAKEKKVLEVVIFDKKITHVKRISKPGQRIYVKTNEIPKPLRGLGLVVVSTPKGVISGQEARKQKLGGELICEIW